ncbi:hypothetical protein [Burkholderia sp. BCC0044]|uniref:hypothetical protein n=1 Tax=Burkholderia sp. BCC0044 TaxID=2676295 RepID=UPI001588A094|nr:hypothetical protein [Burkholderia sp. BCC0044]
MAALPAAMSPTGPQVLARSARAARAVRAPGATTAFTARHAQLNAEVTAAQRTRVFVEAATGQLRALKGAIGAMLSGAGHGVHDTAARIETFDALWRDRTALTGGVLDAQLTVRPAADAVRTFRIRALDVEQWCGGGAETLVFHPAGLGKQSVSIGFDDAPLDAAALARRLDRALAATGVRASLAENGQVDFIVPESRWPDVRDHLLVQGGGKRFPGGGPSRAQADAVSEAVDPARWQLVDRASQRAALRDVVRALDGLAQADRTLRAQLDTAGQRVRGNTDELADAEASRVIHSISGALTGPADFNVLAVVTSTLSGLSRARVETLLRM